MGREGERKGLKEERKGKGIKWGREFKGEGERD